MGMEMLVRALEDISRALSLFIAHLSLCSVSSSFSSLFHSIFQYSIRPSSPSPAARVRGRVLAWQVWGVVVFVAVRLVGERVVGEGGGICGTGGDGRARGGELGETGRYGMGWDGVLCGRVGGRRECEG